LAFTRESTLLEHPVIVSGERLIDLSLVTQQKIGLSLTFDEFNAENVNIIMLGNGTTANVQSGDTIADEAATAPVLLDRSIFTAETNISSLVITGTAGTPTYVLDTDYKLINANTGEIKILSTGSITTGLVLELDYTSAARTRRKILPGKDLQIQGSARIEIDDPINGKNVTWIIKNAQLRIEGDTTIDSENWSQANLILDVLVDKDVTVTEPYGAMYVDA
jgi:hypothetical protein